MKVKRLGAGPV